MPYKCESYRPQWVCWLAAAGVSTLLIVIKMVEGKRYSSEIPLLIGELLAAAGFGIKEIYERRNPERAKERKFPLPTWLATLLAISLFCLVDMLMTLIEGTANWFLLVYLALIFFSCYHLFKWDKARRVWKKSLQIDLIKRE